MPSPFPGMDPYLESPDLWSDVHTTLITYLRAHVNELLPKGYVARVDRHVWIDESEHEPPMPLGKPDIFVAEGQNRETDTKVAFGMEAPTMATLPLLEAKGKAFMKILDAKSRRVITVVELLSPANKSSGRDRDAYLAKREEYFRSGTNLVEMDFLRSGHRPPIEGNLPKAAYYIVVSRSADYPKAGVWPLSIRDPLPTIPIPLESKTEPIFLPIRPSLDRAYEEGRFAEDIDYSQPPQPPLSESDAKWAKEFLKT